MRLCKMILIVIFVCLFTVSINAREAGTDDISAYYGFKDIEIIKLDWGIKDLRIADFNVRHCAEVRGQGPSIDVAYLESLGPDTLPGLLWLAGRIKDSPEAEVVHGAITRLRTELQAELRNWRGWTFRRYRLAQLRFPIDVTTAR